MHCPTSFKLQHFKTTLITLFLINLLNGPLLLAQTSVDTSALSYRLFKLHYQNSGGEKGVSTFAYNANGIQDRAHWELLDGRRYSDDIYTYDSLGHCILKYREFSDSITSHTFYKYNAEGRLISEEFKRSDGVTGITVYEYGTDGKLLKADCQGRNGWFYGLIKYFYNEEGQKTRGEFSRDGVPAGFIEYTYDANKNLAHEYWDFDGKWNQTFRYEYIVYKKNKNISSHPRTHSLPKPPVSGSPKKQTLIPAKPEALPFLKY